MYQVSHIGNRHQGNAGSIKGTSPLGGTRLGLLLAHLIMTFAIFLVIMLTTRLGQKLAHFGFGGRHRSEGMNEGMEQSMDEP